MGQVYIELNHYLLDNPSALAAIIAVLLLAAVVAVSFMGDMDMEEGTDSDGGVEGQ